MRPKSDFQKQTDLTAKNLRDTAQSPSVRQLSRLSLPEIDKVVDLVSKVIPAGNVPGMILSGLTRLSGQRVQPQKVRQDVNILFKEMDLLIDQAKYGAFFAGPAAVIWGYQNILKLAGKDPAASFPEGTWQFYVDYALREDTARHANETHGFDTSLKQHDIRLSAVDRLTAWVMASITCLHGYDSLLANEWYERTATALLQDVTAGTPGSSRYSRLYREWETRRPYGRDAEAAGYDYPSYRRKKFEEFLKKSLQSLHAPVHANWQAKLKAAGERDLSAYQRQMSILAYLDPGPYGETRVPFGLDKAHVGIIHKGNYYLLPVCEEGTGKPLDVISVRAQVASILISGAPARTDLTQLVCVKRASQPALRQKLNPILRRDLEQLRYAPILLNSDPRDRALPLSELRRGERGAGDHPLTIFDTGETFVFDQSHIFFDGAWGAALAEIMTKEALSWAAYLNLLAPAPPNSRRLYKSPALPLEPTDVSIIQQAPPAAPEAGAETNEANVKACQSLRKIFKQRSDLLRLTINDLLVLYRAIHAISYQPSKVIESELARLAGTSPQVHELIQKSLGDSRRVNPSILIPIDASRRVPRDRVYPLNIEVPLAELDLVNLHRQTTRSHDVRPGAYEKFDNLQRIYLATLAGFGEIFNKAKWIATQGESASVGAIKLMALLPLPLQRLLDKIPERYELLNNLLKGSEVFSNLGAVAKESSLTRFISAKDDNSQKQLVWGAMTDAKGIMHITLRDFRPQVAALQKIGRGDLAVLLAQDYLDSYARGLNKYIQEISRITSASHETQQATQKRIPT